VYKRQVDIMAQQAKTQDGCTVRLRTPSGYERTTDPERAGFSLLVDDRPVALDFRGGRSGGRYVVLLPELPRVAGRKAASGRQTLPDGMPSKGRDCASTPPSPRPGHPVPDSIQRPDLTLTADRAATLDRPATK